MILLVDENSASASEVVAGALQDWDRAIIIGRRTFGKGLVQEQYDLTNGAALRLTVARYYCPWAAVSRNLIIKAGLLTMMKWPSAFAMEK